MKKKPELWTYEKYCLVICDNNSVLYVHNLKNDVLIKKVKKAKKK